MKTRTFLVVAFTIASLAALPVGGAAARSRPFRFFGAGWGHGVGMSQWGAYGLAGRGWSDGKILRHYYTGTRVQRSTHPPDRIRVGIVQGRRWVHLQAERAPVQIRIGSRRGPLVGSIPAGATWTVTHPRGRYRIVDSRGRVVGGRTWRRSPVVRYAAVHALVRIPEAGHTYGRGWIQFGVGCAGCSMHLVAVLTPQQYLFGVGEVPSTWPMAAMEAQAVAARTYAFEKISRVGQHQAGCDCGLYASTADQVYAGWDKEAAFGGGRWRGAVTATADSVVTYRGSPIEAFYSSSSGGHTESNADAWGGTPLPYLRSVCDPGDFTPANPNRAWSATLTPWQVGARISRATGRRLGQAQRFVDTTRTAGGRIAATTLVGTRGRVRVSGNTLAYVLGLRSPMVWIDKNRDVLPPLRGRYDRLGCHPGFATSRQIRVRGGLLQRFPNGALYRNARRDATYWLHGAVYDKYRQRGDWAGPLGLPRSDVRRTRRTAVAVFEHGVVSCSSGDCTVRRR